MRCLSARAVDPEAPATAARGAFDGLKSLLVAWGAIDAERPRRVAPGRGGAARRSRADGSALSLANAASHAASVIRERLTHQTWTLIGRLEDGAGANCPRGR